MVAHRWSVLLLLVFAAPLVADPSPKAQPPRGLTDREAHRQSPPQPWRGNGWRAVFPHAYAMLRRVQVRATPDAAAPVAFEIPGGMRVPIYEQRGAWWRVGGTKARAGWARAAEMAPHARCIMLDARTGRVLRQFATKGQWSVLPRNDALWALADTGLTRVAWDGGPHFWSSPVTSSADASIIRDAVLSPDGVRAAVVNSARPTQVERVSLIDGSRQGMVREESGQSLSAFTASSPFLALIHSGPASPARVLDPFHQSHIEAREGQLVDIAPDGGLLERVTAPDAERQGAPVVTRLRRRTPAGQVTQEWASSRPVLATAFSPDHQLLVASEAGRDGHSLRMTVLSSAELHPEATLTLSNKDSWAVGGTPEGIFRKAVGWLAVLAPDEADLGSPRALVAWDAAGHLVSKRHLGSVWTATPNGRRLFLASMPGIERVDLPGGSSSHVKLAWRRPLLKRYLTAVMGRDPHWEISYLTLSPDQKTLIVLERLAGDPEG